MVGEQETHETGRGTTSCACSVTAVHVCLWPIRHCYDSDTASRCIIRSLVRLGGATGSSYDRFLFRDAGGLKETWQMWLQGQNTLCREHEMRVLWISCILHALCLSSISPGARSICPSPLGIKIFHLQCLFVALISLSLPSNPVLLQTHHLPNTPPLSVLSFCAADKPGHDKQQIQ